MGGVSRSGVIIIAAAVVFVGGGAYALGSSKSGTIAVCVNHRSGVLYQAHRCARHDKKLSWSAVGPQGPAGPQGAAGPQGSAGTQGAAGQAGAAGPVTTTAPSGITQYGLFNVDGYETAGNFIGGSISFPLELASAPKWVEVPFGGTNPNPTACPGTADAPAAAPGYLCLYDRISGNVLLSSGFNLQVQDVDGYAGTVSRFGARLSTRASTTGEVEVEGSWAVTAP